LEFGLIDKPLVVNGSLRGPSPEFEHSHAQPWLAILNPWPHANIN
jgi:hypothetical protein